MASGRLHGFRRRSQNPAVGSDGHRTRSIAAFRPQAAPIEPADAVLGLAFWRARDRHSIGQPRGSQSDWSRSGARDLLVVARDIARESPWLDLLEAPWFQAKANRLRLPDGSALPSIKVTLTPPQQVA